MLFMSYYTLMFQVYRFVFLDSMSKFVKVQSGGLVFDVQSRFKFKFAFMFSGLGLV